MRNNNKINPLNAGTTFNEIKDNGLLVDSSGNTGETAIRKVHVVNYEQLQNKLDYANADRIDLAQQNKELKQDYYNLINKIENKIDRFDYEFEKAKRQNDKDKSDYYWDLIRNFKKLLGGE